ncbi:interphotoreceptor retinoid-binding protein [Catellatospora sp. TT07R-123]|uniref:S41 family peptidase n=1 Tax=Catellatospora sp. TT07R-123 TaxID=2733863 RepID=UPI001B0881F1|nr:S41 family peptidase [Catellatospora sp. TT07R-123]GHJ44302.1 interphotoreceptor retinoid-binding protein [Catellatospora sp. TT07R-123]
MTTPLVEAALEQLCKHYVFPDRALAGAEIIRSRDYTGLSEADLCVRLTEDLFEIFADKHLRVRIRPVELQESGQSEEAAEAAWRDYLRVNNFGIARAERLAGNIGYLDLHNVTSPDVGASAIAAAMQLVEHTEALIIDLRRNRGGSPDGAIFWCSYFFKDEQTHLNSIYDGTTRQTRQYWSLAWVPGRRYLDRPVYALTSDTTFSGGEEIAYNLQAQRRAVLIGQTTRGGAHPTDRYPLSDTVEITVPFARSVNPVTETNWEGVGVQPDVEVSAEQAYAVAYRRALEHVVASAGDRLVVEQAQEALAALA